MYIWFIYTSSTNNTYTKQISANDTINTASQKASNVKHNTANTLSSSYSNSSYKPSYSYSSSSYKTSSSYSNSSYKQNSSYPSSKATSQGQAVVTSKVSGYAIITRSLSTHNKITKKPTTTVSSNIKTTTISNNGKPIYISSVSRAINCNIANSIPNNGVPKDLYNNLESLKYNTPSLTTNNRVPKDLYSNLEGLKYGNNATISNDEKTPQITNSSNLKQEDILDRFANVAQKSGDRILHEAVEVHSEMGAGIGFKIKEGPFNVQGGTKLISVNYDYNTIKSGEWGYYPVVREGSLAVEIEDTPLILGEKLRNIVPSKYNMSSTEKELGIGIKLIDTKDENLNLVGQLKTNGKMNLREVIENIPISLGNEIYVGSGIGGEFSIKPVKIAKILYQEFTREF